MTLVPRRLDPIFSAERSSIPVHLVAEFQIVAPARPDLATQIGIVVSRSLELDLLTFAPSISWAAS